MLKYIVAFSLCAAAVCARAETVFRIGVPDARAAEFLNFGVNFNYTRYNYPHGTNPFEKTHKFFSKPFVFNAGRDADSSFPFVMPIRACEWADADWLRPHADAFQYSATAMEYVDRRKKDYPPFEIKFDLEKIPAGDLFLKIGFADKAPVRVNDVSMRVGLNGAPLETFYLPYRYVKGKTEYPCFASVLLHPQTWGIPKTSVVRVPRDRLKRGANSITLKGLPSKATKSLKIPQWIIFDYIELSDTPEPPAVENPYQRARAEMLASLDFDEIVFTMRGTSPDAHWYGNFGRYPDAVSGYDENFVSPLKKLKYSAEHGMLAVNPPDAREDGCVYSTAGGKLVKFNIKTNSVEELLSDPRGGVRNVCVDYDADKMLFSYRKGGTDQYHLFESKIDGSQMKPFPFSGGKFDDIEGTYLPDGDVVFVSSRCQRTVPCWMVDVAVLHRWYARDRVLRQISANIDQDNTPAVTPDGRLVYMKWEYVQKSQLNFHGLWKKDPNGANDMVFFGNDIPRGLLIDAKPFPRENKYAFCYSTFHGRRDHKGQLAVIDNPRNPGDYKSMSFVSGDHPDMQLSTPFPLSANYILASENDRLYVFDLQGHAFALELPESFKPFAGTHIFDAQPVRKRPREQMPADMADYDTDEATVVVVDSSIGRNMRGVKRGDIKKLLVLEVLPNMIHLFGGEEPISLRGTFSFERCLGTVNVEDDGSAHFKAPANRALSFVALDENGRAIKRMQSFTNFVNGTTTSCIGCHEHRNMAPPPLKKTPKALARAADKIAPVDGISPREVIDFVRDIQPVLDKHCVRCHNPRDFRGKVDLSAGMGPMFPRSYWALRTLRQIKEGDDRDGNMPPRTFGSGGSDMVGKIDGSHKGVRLAPAELRRLYAWLDMGGTAAESSAAVQSGMLGYYYSNILMRADENWAENKSMAEVFDRRCSKCHNGKLFLPRMMSGDTRDPDTWIWLWNLPKNSPRNRLSAHAAFNFTRPADSPVLVAPLSKKAGGRGGVSHPSVFKSTDDADYKTVLAAITKARDYLAAHNPRYTDKNYKPRGAYYGALLRRGIVGKDDDLTNFDAFEADKKYWDKVIDPPAQEYPQPQNNP